MPFEEPEDQENWLFVRTIESFKTEVANLYKRRSFMPCLMLLYSFIDILAWLRYKGEFNGVGRRYKTFVNEYLLPKSKLKCSADEIYSERCGILHSYSSGPNETKGGKIRKINYYAPDKEGDSSENENIAHRNDFVVINIKDMISAFENSIEKILNDMRNDVELGIELEVRSHAWMIQSNNK